MAEEEEVVPRLQRRKVGGEVQDLPQRGKDEIKRSSRTSSGNVMMMCVAFSFVPCMHNFCWLMCLNR